MENAKYNLSELFQLAFGQNLPVYVPQSIGKTPKNGIEFSGVTVTPDQEATRMSWLGTPILYPVKFKKGRYVAYSDSGAPIDVDRGDFYLPPATLVDFYRAKNITKTPVLGHEGTVKEIYGFDDWRIRIKGLCLDEPSQTALEQLKQLLEWEKLASQIEVSGKLFSEKGIDAIAIESIEIKQVQGKPGVVPFTITALSDEHILLKDKDNNEQNNEQNEQN